MFEATFVNRQKSLLAVKIADRRKQFLFGLAVIESNAMKRKIFRSSTYLEQIHEPKRDRTQRYIVKNLGDAERASLISALEKTEHALQGMSRPGEQQWAELLKITVACLSGVNSSAPDNTRLLPMFHVLGTSIQSIASAQPATEHGSSHYCP